MASARKPLRLNPAIALCTTRVASRGTLACSRIGASASYSRVRAISIEGSRAPDTFNRIETALNVVELQPAELGQLEIPPLAPQ